jgi:hypothetical protein
MTRRSTTKCHIQTVMIQMVSQGHGIHPIVLIKFFDFALKRCFIQKSSGVSDTPCTINLHIRMQLLVRFSHIRCMVINHLKYIFQHFRVYLSPSSETNVMSDGVAICIGYLCSGHARLKIKYSHHFHSHNANP